MYIRSRNWKSGQGPTKGCRAITITIIIIGEVYTVWRFTVHRSDTVVGPCSVTRPWFPLSLSLGILPANPLYLVFIIALSLSSVTEVLSCLHPSSRDEPRASMELETDSSKTALGSEMTSSAETSLLPWLQFRRHSYEECCRRAICRRTESPLKPRDNPK
jgi:hypothetical protein